MCMRTDQPSPRLTVLKKFVPLYSIIFCSLMCYLADNTANTSNCNSKASCFTRLLELFGNCLKFPLPPFETAK